MLRALLIVLLTISYPVLASCEFEDSPFAITDFNGLHDEMENLGAHWTRISGVNGAVWDRDQPSLQTGEFKWTSMNGTVAGFKDRRINILCTIHPFNADDREPVYYPEDNGRMRYGLPNNIPAYKAYIRALVKTFPEIRTWQIGNEPGNEWLKGEERFASFAQLVKHTSEALYAADANCTVVLAGAATSRAVEEFFKPVLAELDKLRDFPGQRFFDVFDLHWSGQFEDGDKEQATYAHVTLNGELYTLKDTLVNIRSVCAAIGHGDVNIWITEMSDYSGQPIQTKYLFQTEREHAASLVKRYVHSIALGVDKVFWTAVREYVGECGEPGNYFDMAGLINNDYHDGDSSRKLAYYSFKKMTDVLECADFNAVETVMEQDGTRVYFFPKGGGVYVAWTDKAEPATVSIPMGNATQCRILEALPDAAAGKDLDAAVYPEFFKETTASVMDGTVSLQPTDSPVYIFPR